MMNPIKAFTTPVAINIIIVSAINGVLILDITSSQPPHPQPPHIGSIHIPPHPHPPEPPHPRKLNPTSHKILNIRINMIKYINHFNILSDLASRRHHLISPTNPGSVFFKVST
jgi:hypothetical protein